MIKSKKRLVSVLISCLCFFTMGNVFGQEESSAQVSNEVKPCPEIDEAVFQQLWEKEEIRTQYFKEDVIDFKLSPKTELGAALNNTWTEKKDPVFLSESLFLIKKPGDSEKLDIDLISKIMRSISSMEGIEYYSNSDKRMKTLYHQSFTIDSIESGNKIPDKTEGSADNLTIFAFQEDGSFGENYYQIDYRQTENEVSMVIKLKDSLKYGIITAVRANNLVFNIDVLDKGQYLVMYIGAKINFPAISFLENKLNSSFGARVSALHSWFKTSYLSAKEAELQ